MANSMAALTSRPSCSSGDDADTNSSEDTGDFNTPPKPATGPTCIGFLHNCNCPQCVNMSRQTAHGKPIPDTEGVMEMDSLGQKDLMKDKKKSKDPPSPLQPPF